MSLFFCRLELNFCVLSEDRLPIRKEHCRYLPVYTARVKRGWGGGGGGGDGGGGCGGREGVGCGGWGKGGGCRIDNSQSVLIPNVNRTINCIKHKTQILISATKRRIAFILKCYVCVDSVIDNLP